MDHVDPTRAQFDAFKDLPRDTPIAMLNLLRFRERAAYPADHPHAVADLSGAAAYRLYGEESGPFFRRVGGGILWSGRPEEVLIGPPDEQWHAAFIAHYPTASAFLEMVTDPIYREAVIHRQAAVQTSRLIRTAPREAAAPSPERQTCANNSDATRFDNFDWVSIVFRQARVAMSLFRPSPHPALVLTQLSATSVTKPFGGPLIVSPNASTRNCGYLSMNTPIWKGERISLAILSVPEGARSGSTRSS